MLMARSDDDAVFMKELARQLSAYARPATFRSVFELVLTLSLFVGLWAAIYVGLQAGYWAAYVLAVPAAGLMLRLFIIQHDCGHGAFFAGKRANDRVGAMLGVMTLTPYAVWKKAHARHHATSGNLARRGTGDIDTYTVAEYRSMSPMRRFAYRSYRHPAVMFGIGPAFLFLLRNRLPVGDMKGGWKPWISAMGTNGAIVVLIVLMSLLLGVEAVFLIHFPIILLAASFGVWLFFVQHQFEETHWSDDDDWSFHTAAIRGSSFYALPRSLHWLSGNIGYHHIHHLVSRIPFYRLPQVMKDHPVLGEMGTVTIRQSVSGIRLALWDEERQRLVSFRTAKNLETARS
ncbi:fatty acid desaturase [Croceicoccus marinus]|nr:fatty acid desaturase [Croceicoccus marinus]